MKTHDRHLLEALDLADRLLALAEQGNVDCIDDGCSVLYGVVRDCGYKIRRLAEEEQALHARSARAAPPAQRQQHCDG